MAQKVWNVLKPRNLELGPLSRSSDSLGSWTHWKLARDQDGVLWLVLDKKGAGANTLSKDVLAELDDRKIGFITLRARHPGITKTLAVLPASAWKPTTLPGRRQDPPRQSPPRPRRDPVGLPPPDPPARRHRPSSSAAF